MNIISPGNGGECANFIYLRRIQQDRRKSTPNAEADRLIRVVRDLIQTGLSIDGKTGLWSSRTNPYKRLDVPIMAHLQEAYHSRFRASEASKAMRREYCSNPHTVVILCLSAFQTAAKNLSPTDRMQGDKGAHSSVWRIRLNTTADRVTVPFVSDRCPSWNQDLSQSDLTNVGGRLRLCSSRRCPCRPFNVTVGSASVIPRHLKGGTGMKPVSNHSRPQDGIPLDRKIKPHMAWLSPCLASIPYLKPGYIRLQPMPV